MSQATVRFHLPDHRTRALELQSERERDIAAADYDSTIGAYLGFLREQGAAAGIAIDTDTQATGVVFTILAEDRHDKMAAHAWLETQPDIWNWMP